MQSDRSIIEKYEKLWEQYDSLAKSVRQKGTTPQERAWLIEHNDRLIELSEQIDQIEKKLPHYYRARS